MNKTDYYEILGIPKNASADEIKKAYRKLAREHHPDMVKDSDKAKAEQRFKEINEAYQILSDPQKRAMYDQYGHAGTQNGGFGGQSAGSWGPFSYSYSNSNGGANPFGDFGNFDPFDVFEEFFGFRGFGGNRAPRKGKNLYYEMHLSFAESLFGLEKEVQAESGVVKIKIPGGVRDGMEIRFAGKGMPGPQGAPAGDMYITVRVNLPAQFKISGNTLVVETHIDFVLAALGGVVEVPVIDLSSASGLGKAGLKIPAGTQYGSRFVLRGKGLPHPNSRGQADVLVLVAVDIPRKLNKKQKEILESYPQA